MIRVTIEMLPGGDPARAYVLGLIEIANISQLRDNSDYAVVLKKCPPYSGALKAAWKKGFLTCDDECVNAATSGEDDELTVRTVRDFNRVRQGCYDLLFRAMKACGLDSRNP